MTILNPIKKLDLLREYMGKRINMMPREWWSFEAWVKKNRPQFYYGSLEYYRDCSTNCYYCRKEFTTKNFATIDHFYPQSKGDHETYGNIFVISCTRCNNAKANKHPEAFMAQMKRADRTGFLLTNFSEKDIRRISNSVDKIHADILLGHRQKIYYVSMKNNKIPKHFINIPCVGSQLA